MNSDDPTSMSRQLRESLSSLRDLLDSAHGDTMDDVPKDFVEVRYMAQKAVAVLSLLASLHCDLFQRVLQMGDLSYLGSREYQVLGPIFMNVETGDSREIARKARELLEAIESTLLCCNDDALKALPPEKADVPEYLALVLSVERLLTWVLDVFWYRRLMAE